MAAEAWFRWDGATLVLALRVQPRAGRDEFLAPHGDHLKVRITAPPVEGKANAHLLRWLADAFGVPRARVTLAGGDTARNKLFRIERPAQIPPVLQGLLSLPGG
jgi:uncharacterized protein